MDILGEKYSSSAVNAVDKSLTLCTSYAESKEESGEELRLGHYDAGLSMMNEGEVMETLLNEWQYGSFGPRAGSSLEHPIHKEKCPTSKAWDNMTSADILAGQPSDSNRNLNPSQLTYTGSDALLQNTLFSRGTRMKIISKSSGCPEYFIKSMLLEEGFLYKGPISTGVELRSQNIVKAAATIPTTLDPSVDVGDKSGVQSACSTPGFNLGACQEAITDGVSLREWMKSGQNKVHKLDSFLIFKHIVDLVNTLHSEGKVLLDLCPSCFWLLPSKMVKYCGRLSVQLQMHRSTTNKDVQKLKASKRAMEQGMSPYFCSGTKHRKSTDNVNLFKMKSKFQPGYGLKPMTIDFDARPESPRYELKYHSNADSKIWGNSSWPCLPTSAQRHFFSAADQSEKKWYRSPEELFGRGCTCSSNIYSLGVFLFELLSSFDSGEVHAAAMSDLRHRILPPNFLSENPTEAGSCLWLLHPEPVLRPKSREILQSEVVSGFQASCGVDKSSSIRQNEGESELLLHFLMTMKERRQKDASKLGKYLRCVEADIKELEKRNLRRNQVQLAHLRISCIQEREFGFPMEISIPTLFLTEATQGF